jgi:anti-sigma B factor antagonist
MSSTGSEAASTNGGASRRPDEFAPLRVTEEALPDGMLLFGVQGELEAASADRLADAVFSALDGGGALHGGPKVIVDLGRCPFIDSTGLGVLLRIARRLRASDGPPSLALVEGQAQVRRIFQVTKLDGNLRVYPTRGDAIASLRPPTVAT